MNKKNAIHAPSHTCVYFPWRKCSNHKIVLQPRGQENTSQWANLSGPRTN